MGIEGVLPWVAMGTTVDWGREWGDRDLRKRDLQWIQCAVRRDSPKGVVAGAMERKGAKRKVEERQTQVGRLEERLKLLAWAARGAQGKSPVFQPEV